MAHIFLSYDREDGARARPIAALLERSGHSVWWDRQIIGGSEFGAEIEAALAQADKVIVLWSRRAVKSAWVRDEAAVGRDTRRLVPVTLDGTLPPLGFRQFQTIDLSKWRGRGSSPQLQALLRAVSTPEHTLTSVPPKAGNRLNVRPGRPLLLGGSVALVLLAAAASAVWLWNSTSAQGAPTIAVAPADSSLLSRQVAHDLTLRVSNLSNNDAFQLVEAATGPVANADLVLSSGATSSDGQERRDLALRSGNGAILWSASVTQPTSDSANLSQQLAIQAQRALACTAEAFSYRRERMQAETLKQYVSGCTNFDNAYGTNPNNSEQIKLFEQVVAKAPHFEPAWAKLIISEFDELLSVDDPQALQRTIGTQVRQAQNLGLDFGELYAGRVATLSPADFLGIFRTFDEGIRRHPDNAILHRLRGERLFYVGRMNDSIGDAASAVQLDSLSPANLGNLASAYAYAGNIDAGYAELRKAEQLWPGAPTIIFARFRLDLRFGDAKEAQKLLQEPIMQGELQAEQTAFIKARIDPSPANIERAIAEDRKIYEQYPFFIGQIVQTLAQFGRNDEVLDILIHYSGGEQSGFAAEVLFRPALRDVWRNPRSIAAAAHLGLLHYWKVSGRWPDFCSDPGLPYNCKKEAARYRV